MSGSAAKAFRPQLLRAESDLLGWIGQASPGSMLEYHRGFLALDRTRYGGLREQEADELSRMAAVALRAAEFGLVHLLQRRLDRDVFSYVIIAREGKPGAWPALLKTKPYWGSLDQHQGVLADAA